VYSGMIFIGCGGVQRGRGKAFNLLIIFLLNDSLMTKSVSLIK